MGGMRCILTGFSVGVLLGVAGFFIAVSGHDAPAAAQLIVIDQARGQSATTPPTKSLSSGEAESAASFTVRNEPGGYVVEYAMRMMRWREDGTLLRFTGSCDSACTLYLALPYEQTCIAQGASFRFHAPTARTLQARILAESFMLRTYPEWVREWIEGQGGLSKDLVTMSFDYARQHMRTCDREDMPRVAGGEESARG